MRSKMMGSMFRPYFLYFFFVGIVAIMALQL